MSFPPFTASHNEPAIPCTASQKTSHCYSHSVQLPSCCSLTAYLLYTTINRLPFAPSSQRPDLSLLSKLHTIPPHLLTHAVNLPHLPSHCFKTCYFCTYGETTDLYVGSQASYRSCCLSLTGKTFSPLFIGYVFCCTKHVPTHISCFSQEKLEQKVSFSYTEMIQPKLHASFCPLQTFDLHRSARVEKAKQDCFGFT